MSDFEQMSQKKGPLQYVEQSMGYQNKAYLEMHYDFAKKYGYFTSKAY